MIEVAGGEGKLKRSHSHNVKSEYRNPKSEGSLNSEIRSPKRRPAAKRFCDSGDGRVARLSRAWRCSWNCAQRVDPPRFGFRVSDFGFPSDFGFRTSDFTPSRLAAFPHR
jgi:hypothetical protein